MTLLLGGLAYLGLSCLAGLAVARFMRVGRGRDPEPPTR